jgi:hypothetical protein
MCQPVVSANQNAASTLDILGMVEAYRPAIRAGFDEAKGQQL